jgi:hypothetical protein
VDVRVGVDAKADGSGVVRVDATLDQGAVEQLVGRAAGDPATVEPATRIKVDDLRKTGWTIDGPDERAGSGLRIVARHGFRDAAEARQLLEEVGGIGGPIEDVHLRQHRTFFTTRTDLTAVVDLSAGLGAFTGPDPDLRRALEATDEAPLGITQSQLEQRIGTSLEQALGLDVDVRIPGAHVTRTTPLGRRTTIRATSERWNVRNVAALAVAVLTAAALVASLLRTRRAPARTLTVTDGNITLPPDGETGADDRGT